MRILLVLILLSSCSTIHYRFDNEQNGIGEKQWHHIGILQMVEFSDPYRPFKHCPKGINEITSRRNFFQSLLAFIPWVGWVWSPRELKVECSNSDIYASNEAESKGDNSSSNNANTNTININITPEMLKKKTP